MRNDSNMLIRLMGSAHDNMITKHAQKLKIYNKRFQQMNFEIDIQDIIYSFSLLCHRVETLEVM